MCIYIYIYIYIFIYIYIYIYIHGIRATIVRSLSGFRVLRLYSCVVKACGV